MNVKQIIKKFWGIFLTCIMMISIIQTPVCIYGAQISIPAGAMARRQMYFDEIYNFGYQILDDGTAELTSYLGSELDVIIPNAVDGNTVTSLSNNLFFSYKDMESVFIPDTVTNIGRQVFEDCTKITSITLPKNLTSIGAATFKNCTGLTTVNLPDKITKIPDSLFFNCSNLKSVTWSDNVTSIGLYAFRECKKLRDIGPTTNVTSIGKYAFYQCHKLKDIELADGIEKIDDGTFTECKNITSIIIPDSVKEIGENAFSECSKLSSIKMSSEVEKIDIDAFSYCKKLTRIQLPNTLKKIYEGAFDHCDKLTIYCKKNSKAHKFAKEFDLKYSLTNKKIKVSSVKLSETKLKLKKGDTVTLEASVLPVDATNTKVTWKSSNKKVATVTKSGKVKAVGSGTATITATAADGSKKTATCKITVPYTIKYKLNGGTNHAKNPDTYYNEKISLKKPTREGYIFKGWYTDKKFKNKITSIKKNAKKNYTLYAKWKKIK